MRRMAPSHDAPPWVAGASLYLLLTRKLCRVPPLEVVRAAIAGGCDVVQVRDARDDLRRGL